MPGPGQRNGGNFSGQGGPPRVGLPGTIVPPAAHPFPSQTVDPSILVGPSPELKADPSPTWDARGIPVGPLGAPAPARLDSFFVTRFPDLGLTPWHRKITVQGTTVIAASRTYNMQVAKLAAGQSLIVLQVVQLWLDAGLNPLDVNQLTAYQDQAAAYGRVSMIFCFNEGPAIDAQETLYDPGSGATTISGFTILNQNILNVGDHPTALFSPDGASVGVKWVTGTVLPGKIPTAVGVQVDGYLLPTKSLRNIARALRTGL